MGGEEVRWKTVRTYGKILATPLFALVFVIKQSDATLSHIILDSPLLVFTL